MIPTWRYEFQWERAWRESALRGEAISEEIVAFNSQFPEDQSSDSSRAFPLLTAYLICWQFQTLKRFHRFDWHLKVFVESSRSNSTRIRFWLLNKTQTAKKTKTFRAFQRTLIETGWVELMKLTLNLMSISRESFSRLELSQVVRRNLFFSDNKQFAFSGSKKTLSLFVESAAKCFIPIVIIRFLLKRHQFFIAASWIIEICLFQFGLFAIVRSEQFTIDRSSRALAQSAIN